MIRSNPFNLCHPRSLYFFVSFCVPDSSIVFHICSIGALRANYSFTAYFTVTLRVASMIAGRIEYSLLSRLLQRIEISFLSLNK